MNTLQCDLGICDMSVEEAPERIETLRKTELFIIIFCYHRFIPDSEKFMLILGLEKTLAATLLL